MNEYVTRPALCTGEGDCSIPVAHLVLRRCQTTGNFYYTVDADPHQNCPLHDEHEDFGGAQ